MITIKTEDLQPAKSLPKTLYYKSGDTLLEAGESLSREDIDALKRFNINEVIQLDPDDDRRDFLLSCHYRTLKIAQLPNGKTLNVPLTDAKGSVILQKNTLINNEIKKQLAKRGMVSVYVKKSTRERGVTEAREFKIFHAKLTEARIIQRVNEEVQNLKLEDSQFIRNPRKDITVRGVEQQLQKGAGNVKPRGDPLEQKMIQRPKKTKRTASVKNSFVEVKDTVEADVFNLFQHFKEKDVIDGNYVSDLSKKIIGALIRDKDLLLNLLNMESKIEYLAKHSMHTAIIAVNIATALDYSSKQILEMAYAALLHDVGMFRISEKVRDKTGRLTQHEFLEIQKHPTYNLDYLQRVRRIPMSTPIVTYQIHERLDRSGYPKQKSGNLIHGFAKIIAVADVYSALTSDRPYRKKLSPFRASRTLVDMGSEGKLDVNCIRNFLKFVCLFPVGSWVRLNNGHIGKVISANADDYTRPVITIMYDRNLGKIRNYVIDLREEPKLGIVDGLPADSFLETGVMDGF